MSNLAIWNIGSLAWAEIGPDDKQISDCAKGLAEKYTEWSDIDRVIFRDICGSFSLESASLLLALIPLLGLLLVTPMPDWGYEEEYLKKRIEKWESKPVWLHYLNHIRVIGYPLALFFIINIRNKLKRAYIGARYT